MPDFGYQKNSVLLAGTLAPVVIAIIGSRTVSGIAVGPIFFMDLVLLTSACLVAVTIDWSRLAADSTGQMKQLVWLAVLVGVALAHLLTGQISSSALRDFAPFFYLLYGLGTALVLGILSEKQLRLGVKLVWWALVGHWVLISGIQLAMFFEEASLSRLVLSTTTLRPDLDGALLACLAATMIYVGRVGNPIRQITANLFSSLIVVQIILLGSRAAVLAAVLATTFVIARSARNTLFPRKFIATAITVLTIPLILVAPQTAVGDKFLGGAYVFSGFFSHVTNSPETTSEVDYETTGDQNGSAFLEAGEQFAGPTAARIRAWRTLALWITSDWERSLWGYGFGNNHMLQSGALEDLVGPSPRETTTHPHNFILQSAALVGIPITVVLLAHIFIALSKRAPRGEKSFEKLSDLARLLAITIVVVSLVGVVWEQPTGAIILSFSIGVGLASISRDARRYTTTD